jgi:hypothetical protein
MIAGRLPDRARLGDVDRAAVRRDLEVVQHREEAGDAGREVVAMDLAVGRQVERDQPRLPAPVFRVVERPEPVLAVDPEREDALVVGEGRRRVRHGLAVAELVDLRRRAAVGMEREEDAAARRHRDVAGRVVEIDDRLDGRRGNRRRRGAVLEARPPAARRGERDGHDQPGALHFAGASASMYERMRAVLTPMSPLPSRDLERMSTFAPTRPAERDHDVVLEPEEIARRDGFDREPVRVLGHDVPGGHRLRLRQRLRVRVARRHREDGRMEIGQHSRWIAAQSFGYAMSRPAFWGIDFACVNAGGSARSVVKSLMRGWPPPWLAGNVDEARGGDQAERAAGGDPVAANELDQAHEADDRRDDPAEGEHPEPGERWNDSKCARSGPGASRARRATRWHSARAWP